ncbi:MAG: patatin-like phospholipase family protein, partial [Thermoanaerobaculia bacterium]
GTSTGAIIAALLAYGRLTAEQILAEYDRMVGRIFDRDPRQLFARGLLRRRIYSRQAALDTLNYYFGRRTLRRMPVRSDGEPQALLLTTHDLLRNEELFLSNYPFRSGKPNFGRNWKIRDAVAASALSAPWYFGPYDGRFVDGGVTVFNCPARQAAVEALDYCARPLFERGRTCVWSIGSGTFAESLRAGEADGWHLWDWARRIESDVQGDAEGDQIFGAERLARRGEIAFRRYQVRIDDATLKALGLPGARTELPIALDRADAVDFLHRVGIRFAARIDWSLPQGVYPPALASPLEDPGLWRSAAPKPRPPRTPPRRRSARIG